jgi:hypothetical protein
MPRATPYILAAAIVSALTAPSLFFACTPGPTNFIDATDIPTGGLGVDPGVVTCGHYDGGCNEFVAYCCIGPGAAGGAICTDASTCPSHTGLVYCNESADCFQNTDGTIQACCATFDLDAGTTASTCSMGATTCAAPTLQLCRTNRECPNKNCVIQKCPDGQTYEMCGLSTSASFRCTAVVAGGG